MMFVKTRYAWLSLLCSVCHLTNAQSIQASCNGTNMAYNEGEQTCFLINTQWMSRTDANDFCIERDGRLAQPRKNATQIWLDVEFAAYMRSALWFGLTLFHASESSMKFVWDNGEELQYMSGRRLEYNNVFDEDCVMMRNKEWLVDKCATKHASLCEIKVKRDEHDVGGGYQLYRNRNFNLPSYSSYRERLDIELLLDNTSEDSIVRNGTCAIGNGGCYHFCNDSSGSVVCSCADDYALINGTKCTYMYDCNYLNGGCDQLCSNNIPHDRRCSCKEDYQLAEDLVTCETIKRPECSVNNGGCDQLCHHDKEGKLECSCFPEFKLEDGTSCIRYAVDIELVHGNKTSGSPGQNSQHNWTSVCWLMAATFVLISKNMM